MKEIIVDCGFGQVRIALLEDRELMEIYIEGQEDQSIVGNIYKGKVENVLPGMQAAFIDIGTNKNAFLYIKDILPSMCHYEEEESEIQEESYNISDLLKPSEEILIQVIKDPIDNKGARVTTHITLPGRCAVLMPTVDYIGVSKKIEDETERKKLKEIAIHVKPDNMGIIIRTAGRYSEESDFKSDVDFLLELWKGISEKQHQTQAPVLLHKDINLFFRILRDMFTGEIDKLIINDKEFYYEALKIMDHMDPLLKNKVEYFNKGYDIFDYYHIEEKIEKLLNKKVWLKSGGYIVIEQTEALTAIDVNTGKFIGSKDLHDTVLKTNIEAAKEIARQLRLRDIGGMIIVDFIDMEDEEHKNIVIEVIKKALKKDKSKSCVWGLTHLGLLEMTRKKVVAPKEGMMLSPCPHCDGTGKITSPRTLIKIIEKEVKKFILDKSVRHIIIETHPEINEFLIGHEKYFKAITEEKCVIIETVANASYNKDQYRVLSQI